MASQVYSTSLGGGRIYIDTTITTTPNMTANQSTVVWTVAMRVTGAGNYYQYNNGNRLLVRMNGTEYVNSANVCAIQLSGNGATKTIASGSFTVSHNDDGTCSFPVYVYFQQTQVSGYVSETSQTFACDTIARLSGLSASNGTLGKAQTLTVDKKNSAFTHTITYKCGSASGTVCTKSSNASVSFTPPLSLASQNTTGASVTVVFTIETFNGNESIGSATKTIACAIPASIVPTLSLDVSDIEFHSETYGKYVQKRSRIKVVVTASGAYGSTITSYNTNALGSTYTASYFVIENVNQNGTLAITATVTDSRGRTATIQETIEVLAYEPPKITALKARRCDADGKSNSTGEYLSVEWSASVSYLDGQNSERYTVQYRKAEETEYTSANASGGKFIFEADKNASYAIILTVTDDFEEVQKTVAGSSIALLFSWFERGLGWAFGKVAELENTLEIAFKTRFTGGIDPLVIEAGADLDEYLTPNIYTGLNASTAGYQNCPFTSGSFSLEVRKASNDDSVIQRAVICDKGNPLEYERAYYSGTWGEWVCVAKNSKLLCTCVAWMTSAHDIPLLEPISKQEHGVVLVFSAYTDNEQDADWQSVFVPKKLVELKQGQAHTFVLAWSKFGNICTKKIYIYDNRLVGDDESSATGTANGITYNNQAMVLRYVIGV